MKFSGYVMHWLRSTPTLHRARVVRASWTRSRSAQSEPSPGDTCRRARRPWPVCRSLQLRKPLPKPLRVVAGRADDGVDGLSDRLFSRQCNADVIAATRCAWSKDPVQADAPRRPPPLTHFASGLLSLADPALRHLDPAALGLRIKCRSTATPASGRCSRAERARSITGTYPASPWNGVREHQSLKSSRTRARLATCGDPRGARPGQCLQPSYRSRAQCFGAQSEPTLGEAALMHRPC